MNEFVAYKQEFHFEDEYHRWIYFDFLYEDIKLILLDMIYDEEEVEFYYHMSELGYKILMRNISD
jgi:hypothetical protein